MNRLQAKICEKQVDCQVTTVAVDSYFDSGHGSITIKKFSILFTLCEHLSV